MYRSDDIDFDSDGVCEGCVHREMCPFASYPFNLFVMAVQTDTSSVPEVFSLEEALRKHVSGFDPKTIGICLQIGGSTGFAGITPIGLSLGGIQIADDCTKCPLKAEGLCDGE